MSEIIEDVDYHPERFHEMELDDRILKAIAKLGWVQPTLIQENGIPLLLEGKDVLMRARTGSGKTGAFGIPVIQKILNTKQVSKEDKGVLGLILAPSRELCRQIHSHLLQLTSKCHNDVNIINISQPGSTDNVKPLLAGQTDIIVSTPGRAIDHLKAGNINASNLQMLVVDEADLVFSFGHEDDIMEILKFLPRVYQACLASATLSDQVLGLKKLMLHNAVTIKLEEPHLAPITQLSHYFVYAEEDDKATYLYTLIKLNLLRGKTIVFVNTVDKCYKLKLFLEQFGIRVCVLNSELPASVRCHSVAQFNEGTYNIIIASDEAALDALNIAKQKQQVGKRKKDKESGVSRGIDFQFVSNVLNFDFPLDISSYIHRAGRTARGTNSGTALSFISVNEKPMMLEVDKYLQVGLFKEESIFKKYDMKLQDIEGFRYRCNDAWRASTRIAVREARLKEIKSEIINNAKLKGYFEQNPRELKTLRHDKFAHTIKMQKHMGGLPDYLLPAGMKKLIPVVSKPVETDEPLADGAQVEEVMSHAQLISDSAISDTSSHKFKKRKRVRSQLVSKKSNPLLNLDSDIKRRKRRKK